MTDSPKRNVCFYCRCQLKEGEGRYRFFQNDSQVECCPPCFDETRRLNLRLPYEPETESISGQAEKDS
jgi:hypothetical protein